LLSPPEPLRFSFFLALLRPGSPLPTAWPRLSFFTARRCSIFNARQASPRPAPTAPRSPQPAPPCPSAWVPVPPVAAALVNPGSGRCRPTYPPRPRSLPPLFRPSARAPIGTAPPCPGRALLAPVGAALPIRLSPGPSRCRCTRQPRLQPVPPHLSARAPISPTIVAPVRPGRALATPASAALTRFFFLLVCFFFFQALFFTLLCSRRWL
jgi:hypothetical protein